MHLDLIAICDMANIDVAGKFNIIGEFNTVFAQNPQAANVDITLVGRIIAETTEMATGHQISIALIDADGTEVARLPNQPVSFKKVLPGTSGNLRADFVLTLARASFPHYGSYRFDVLINGRHLGGREFYVLNPQARPAAPEPPPGLPGSAGPPDLLPGS